MSDLTPVAYKLEKWTQGKSNHSETQIESAKNMKLQSLPPMVQTDKRPQDILNENMNFVEREAFAKYLGEFRKNKPDWNLFRTKIPESLLEKIKNVMHECKKIGYISPVVINGEVVFRQVLGQKRNYKNTDKCTLCSSSFIDGTCMGKSKYNKQNQRVFAPCWS